jgi:hypothetical protein
MNQNNLSEMLVVGTVPMLLGFTLFASYAALVLRLATAEVAGIVFWAVGVVILALLCLLIFISAACSPRNAPKHAQHAQHAQAPAAAAVPTRANSPSRRRANAPPSAGLAAVPRSPPASPGGYRNERAPTAAYDRNYRPR